MVVVELMAVKGMVSLAHHIQKRRAERADTEKDVDDRTLATTASSTIEEDKQPTNNNSMTLSDHFQQQEGEHESSHAQDEDDEASIFSSITSPSVAVTGHCSFRPHDSFCIEDMEGMDLTQLDLSTHDVYEMTQRARRGGEEDDLAVAIQAAIHAQEIIAQPSVTSLRIRRPQLKKQGSMKSFLQTGVSTFKKNIETIASHATEGPRQGSWGGFVQDRVDTFSKNMETLSLIVKGDCEVPWDVKQEDTEGGDSS